MLLVTGCDSVKKLVVSDRGLCDGLERPIDKLNNALLIDGGPQSIVAGDEVISGYDAGCNGKLY